MEEYYTVFNYGIPIPQKVVKSKDITKVVGPVVNLSPKIVIPGKIKINMGKKTPRFTYHGQLGNIIG